MLPTGGWRTDFTLLLSTCTATEYIIRVLIFVGSRRVRGCRTLVVFKGAGFDVSSHWSSCCRRSPLAPTHKSATHKGQYANDILARCNRSRSAKQNSVRRPPSAAEVFLFSLGGGDFSPHVMTWPGLGLQPLKKAFITKRATSLRCAHPCATRLCSPSISTT